MFDYSNYRLHLFDNIFIRYSNENESTICVFLSLNHYRIGRMYLDLEKFAGLPRQVSLLNNNYIIGLKPTY